MSETNPNENKKNDTIGEQLNELGKNLRDALQTAWESDERRKLQKEIEDGMANLGASLSQAAKEFSNSPTGQSVKGEMKDINDRWQTGQVGSKVQKEIVEALRKVNQELKKTISDNPPSPTDKPGS